MAQAPLLEVKAISKAFGGVNAVNAVDLCVSAGQIHSLIGPNGAGKTTLFNITSGLYMPSAGSILLDGRVITGNDPNKLAGLGLRRTFQNLQICTGMTALENIMLGMHLRLNSSFLSAFMRNQQLARAERDSQAECHRLMEFVGVSRYANEEVQNMPYGALKRMEIARALAGSPRLLLLDEPAAGLNQSEKKDLSILLREIAGSGVTILLVEHDMSMVMSLSNWITVLANGTKIAEGSPSEVRGHPAVIAAYLGKTVEIIHA